MTFSSYYLVQTSDNYPSGRVEWGGVYSAAKWLPFITKVRVAYRWWMKRRHKMSPFTGTSFNSVFNINSVLKCIMQTWYIVWSKRDWLQ
jgi:hypothetical protein